MAANEDSVRLDLAQERRNLELSTPISYIWIGSAPQRGVTGQDIDGPISMAMRYSTGEISNPIQFFCLEEHRSTYAELLQPHGIEVYSVEETLNQYILTDWSDAYEQEITFSKEATFVKQLMIVSLAPERNTIRDRVNVKNAFSLFLLLIQRGYVFDSNIRPIEGELVALPVPEKFTYSMLTNERKTRNFFTADEKQKMTIIYAGFMDFFMMFSAQKNDATLRKVFNNYMKEWTALQERFKEEGYSFQFHNECAMAMARSIAPNNIYHTASSKDKKQYYSHEYFHFLRPSLASNQAYLSIWNFSRSKPAPSFGIKKIFNGTHKFKQEVSDNEYLISKQMQM